MRSEELRRFTREVLTQHDQFEYLSQEYERRTGQKLPNSQRRLHALAMTYGYQAPCDDSGYLRLAVFIVAQVRKESPVSLAQPVIKVLGERVFVRGKQVQLEFTGERLKSALVFLAELAARPGVWMCSTDIIARSPTQAGVRFSRIYKELPKKIRCEIESARMKGFRLSVA